MDLHRVGLRRHRTREPRARGDGPAAGARSAPTSTRAPRTRGWTGGSRRITTGSGG